MSHNTITMRVPIVKPITHQEVTLPKSVCILLEHVLFPKEQYDGKRDQYFMPGPCKVVAIKAVRAELGLGLKESKDIVDQLTPAMLNGVPENTQVCTLGQL